MATGRFQAAYAEFHLAPGGVVVSHMDLNGAGMTKCARGGKPNCPCGQSLNPWPVSTMVR